MCLFEDQSYGLPSVVPDVGGNGHVIVNGQNGYLYPSGDLNALATRVDAYLADGRLREFHGRAAYANVQTRFTLEKWVWQHMEFYRRIDSTVQEEKMS